MRERFGRAGLACIWLLLWIIVPSCSDQTVTNVPDELITRLTVTPTTILQGEEIKIDMFLWNYTTRQMFLDCDCCFVVQLFTADMQALEWELWPCTTEFCPGLYYPSGSQFHLRHEFSTRAQGSWPSDNGNLPAGMYVVRAGYGDLRRDDNPCPWAQGVFWVVKEK